MIKTIFALAMMFVAPAARAQDNWKDANGQPLPNTESRSKINGFAGMLMTTPDADWLEKWNTQPSVTPHFNEAKSVARDQPLFILIFFSNPMLDSSSAADVACDIDVTGPDGKSTVHLRDTLCYQGVISGPAHNLYLAVPAIRFTGDEKDASGQWRVSVTLIDKLRKLRLPLKTSFVLQ